ncbi:MAG: DUF6438 domain-containing protein [Asticcacaulis sp.]
MRAVIMATMIVVASFASPFHAEAADDEAETVISLQRGACLGPCPDYTVEIRGDGSVIFTGGQYTVQKGEVRYAIDPAEVAGLKAFIDARNFASLQDKYAVTWTDQIWIEVCVTTAQTKKCVEDYSGLNAGMPQSVRDIENEIDRVGRTAPLVKAPQG